MKGRAFVVVALSALVWGSCHSWTSTSPVGQVVVSETSAQPPLIVIEKTEDTNWGSGAELERLKTPYTSYGFDESTHDVQAVLYAIAAHYNLPTRLLYAVHLKETHGECRARSSKKAYGCFQFMASTAKQFGLVGVSNGKAFDRRDSLIDSGDAAARYIVWLAYVMYGDKVDLGNWEQIRHVLAAYNAGIARVFKSGVEPRIPSFFETQKYVHDIVQLAQGDAYFVNDNETLDVISLKTQVPEETLRQSNVHLTESSGVYRGMILSVPDQKTNFSEVMVAPKMSLSKISAGTGVSAQEIMRVNGLTTQRLKTGMVLKIPVDQAPQ